MVEENPFVAAPVALGSYARWTVHPPTGPAIEIYQNLPQTDLLDVVTFLRAAHAAAVAGDFSAALPVPAAGAFGPVPHRVREAVKTGLQPTLADPLVRVFYTHWMEITLYRPGPRSERAAYDWEVWYTPAAVEAAFRRYDRDGRSDPLFEVARAPLDEVELTLRTTGDLRDILRRL